MDKSNSKGDKESKQQSKYPYLRSNESEPVTPCMDVYNAKIQSDGSLDKLKLRNVVRGYLQNKEMVEGTWSPTDSMSTLKYFLKDATKHKERVRQLYFIGAFL